MSDDGNGLPALSFLLSALAPVVAAAGHWAAPESLGAYSLLVWLLALFPVFLLTRHVGWRGTLLALVWVASLLTLAELSTSIAQATAPRWMTVGSVFAVVAVVGLAAGHERAWWSRRLAATTARVRDALAGGTIRGLPTGEVLEYILEKVVAGARRQPPLSVVVFALDRAKEYVDLYGSEAVRRAEDGVAATLLAEVREMNVVARPGEFEFLVLLPGETLTAADRFAGRILEAVSSLEIPWKGRISLSAGIAGFEPAIESPATLVAHARRALEAARGMGGERAVVFRGEVKETLVAPGMLVLEPDGKIREIHRPV